MTVKLKGTQLGPTLCDPMDCTVHGILQARILEWVAFPSAEDLPNPGIKPRSPVFRADSLPAEPPGKPAVTVDLHCALYSRPSRRCHLFNQCVCAQSCPALCDLMDCSHLTSYIFTNI